MQGSIFDIQRYSSHDGPGIRSTVFFMGCPLRCRWCHNPESFSMAPGLYYTPEDCIGCGLCAASCEKQAHRLAPGHQFDRSLCIGCGKCAEVCPTGALKLTGRPHTVDEVWEILSRDIPFYASSGGGVTLSGGEVLLQPEFAKALLTRGKDAGLHTAVDTAGAVPWEAFETVLPLADLFLYDIKAVSPALHRRATGLENGRILENYQRLRATGVPIWVRVPIIPGYTDDEVELLRIAEFLKGQEPQRVELLRFHRMAESKYRALGLTYELADTAPPAMEDMERYRALIEKELNCDILIG